MNVLSLIRRRSFFALIFGVAAASAAAATRPQRALADPPYLPSTPPPTPKPVIGPPITMQALPEAEALKLRISTLEKNLSDLQKYVYELSRQHYWHTHAYTYYYQDKVQYGRTNRP